MRRPLVTATLSALLATTLTLAPMRAALASDDAPAPPTDAGADVTVKPSTPLGSVKVTLRGDRRLRLEREDLVSAGSTATRFAIVCTAPCDVVVPGGSGYRVSGDGLRASGKFTLDVGTHVVDADLGSKTSWAMAPWFVVGGLAVAAGGGIMAWKGSKDASSSGTATVEGDTTLRDVGYVVLGVGIVVAIAGTIALAANGNSVEIDGKAIASRKASSGFALTPSGFVF